MLRFLAFCFALVFVPVVAHAQPDYDAWVKVAERAEEAIKHATATGEGASNETLGDLRAELVIWRSEFATAQTADQIAIQSLNDQITAMGDVPEGGEEPDLAQRRSELHSALEALLTPQKRATQAFVRAETAIDQIDDVITARQRQMLMERVETPLNWSAWKQMGVEIWGSYDLLRQEIFPTDGAIAPEFQTQNLPVIALYLLIGIALIFGGGRISRWAMARLHQNGQDAGHKLAEFAASLGKVALPYLGFISLTWAGAATGMAGARAQGIFAILPMIAIIPFVALWISRQLAEFRIGGLAVFLGLIASLDLALTHLQIIDRYTVEAGDVLIFITVAMAGGVLIMLGRRLAPHSENLLPFLPRALLVIGLILPILAMLGYIGAVSFVMIPVIFSLGLIATLRILFDQVRHVMALTDGQDGLWPIIVNVGLMVVSIPVFALIWGAEISTLREAWSSFMAGFQIGEVVLSPSVFMILVVTFVIGYMITRLIQRNLKTNILPKTRLDQGGQTALVSGIGYIGIFISAIVAISVAGIDMSSLAIVAGALSVGIGFGLQNIVSNFVSGIILLIERPISEGDWIEVGGKMGYVRDISVRSTRIETFDRSDVIVPNADLISGAVTNYTRGNMVGRIVVPVGVAYGNDTRRICEMLLEIAQAHPMVLKTPGPSALFRGFGADALDFEIRAMLSDVNYSLSVSSELNHQIAEKFAAEGIEIPFAQRDIWLRNPEALIQTPK